MEKFTFQTPEFIQLKGAIVTCLVSMKCKCGVFPAKCRSNGKGNICTYSSKHLDNGT